MSGILQQIVCQKRREVEAAKFKAPIRRISVLAAKAPEPREFKHALDSEAVSLIAEVKRASPSKPNLAPLLDVVAQATVYERNGASCCSVLTDMHFDGTLDDLERVRAATTIPVLRKDFVFDEYQVYESRARGADAVLLIAAITREPEELARLVELCLHLGMLPLVEVHDAQEVSVALGAGAGLIGINNRDLRTFATDIKVTKKIRPLVPAHVPVVSESGIRNRLDVLEVAGYGVQAVLVGEVLVRAQDAAALTRELVDAGKMARGDD